MRRHLFKLILLVFLISALSTKSQTWAWAKSGDGGWGSEGFGSCTDNNGNVFITGLWGGPPLVFGSYTLTNGPGEGNIYLTKYDSNGNVIWAQSSSGGAGEGHAVSADPAGNVFVTGHFNSPVIIFGSYTLTNSGFYDLFLVKYDMNGNVLWATSAIGTDWDFCYAVSSDISGNSFITGQFKSPTLVIGTFTLNNIGGFCNVFVIKYGPNGNVLWARSSIGPDGAGNGISTDGNGDTYLTGSYTGSVLTFGTYTLNNSGNEDVFIVKYNGVGNVMWAQNHGSWGQDKGSAIKTDITGNSYLTGFFASPTIAFGSYTLNNTGVRDIFIAKYNTNGTVIWATSATGIGSDIPYSIDINDYNLYISGQFINPLIIGNYTLTAPLNSNDRSFIARYDLNGNPSYAEALLGGGDDQNSICVDKMCNAYFSGDFMITPFILGTNTLVITGGENPFVAKLANPIPTVNIISSPSLICVGQSATLIASGASTYSWNPIAAVGNSVTVSPTVTSIYTVAGTNSATGCKSTQVFTLNVSLCENIKEIPYEFNASIYPNPNNGSFKIQIISDIKSGQLILINSIGQYIFEQKIIQGANDIKTTGLLPGMYNYILRSDNQTLKNGKLTIE